MKKLLLTCCALAIGASAGPSMAKDVDEYAVKAIQYKNRGVYTARVVVRFKIKTSSGKTVTCKMNGNRIGSFGKNVQTGEEMHYNLGDTYHTNGGIS